ncbi:MAG: S-layer homology domain-containing protein [Defluviitaleaceae bacterium]|nr:S-layer homology domain-containing protein [Defluviitaleaceae bacterium]
MKKIFRKAAAALLCLVFVLGGAAQVQASNFRDVGPGLNWAREAIDTVSELGIMMGDLSGNFNPNSAIDKFETVRILARMSGFDPSALTPQETAYYNAVYQARRPVIMAVANRFNRWNANVNREIAYLLYTGVLTAADLENFVVIEGGVERLRALSREEAAVFLVRFMGRTQAALSTVGVRVFYDDHLISPGAKPHIYYLRSHGIMNGDDRNNVSPRAATTRAAMAMLVYATLIEVDSPLLGLSGSGAGAQIDTVSGTIAATYPNFRSILVSSTNAANNNRILPITNAAIITVGGLNATFGDLQRDMTFTAQVTGGEIISIAAQTAAAGTTPPTNNNDVPARTLDGVVARVNNNNNTVGIEIRVLNPRGEIITRVEDYAITGSTSISRAGVATNQANIAVGDLAVAVVRGGNIESLELEERFRQVSGTLVEKNFSASSIFPILVVEDAAGVNHSFSVDGDSVIRRQGTFGNIAPRSLRIGDAINLHAEYGRITEANASGTTSVADVFIRDIFISSREQNHIVVSDTLYGSQDRRHLIIDGAVDMQSITAGSRVRLWLDSQEVSGITVLQTATADNFSGHITNIGNQQISVRDANFVTRHFTFDNSTVFFNSITGRTVNINELTIGMRVQVVTAPAQNHRAASVTVLINQ